MPRVASSPSTPFNGTLNGAPFKSEPSGRTRVWQPLQSETPSDSPLDVGTHRKPSTLPSFWARPPRRANSSADRAIAMICGSVLRKAGTSISSKTRLPLSIHSASVRAPGAMSGSGFLARSISQ